MSNIKPCPCGKIPEKLIISDSGQGGKYALCSGYCCQEWMIEFRANYANFESDECQDLAKNAWNNSPRGEIIKKLQKLERIENVLNRYWELNRCYPGNDYWANEFLQACLKD